ncbi:hypothetical protein DFH29DRAFT_922014 [Suillus ampliporus]|nr:hypothetical protein DFH29DRAFT_922014 [Suillus ampliporus]
MSTTATITMTAPPSTSTIKLAPAQSHGEASSSQAQNQPPKSQKQMTKAERRRATRASESCKAAAKTSGPQPSGSNQNPAQAKKGAPPAAGTSASVKKGAKGTDGKPAKETKEITSDDSARGLRIFSHFGLPKPPGPTKGDIHPAIIRLGLQFSEFKIAGANARCIATLTAFKTVIQDYVTPPNNTLSRHLLTHLSPQITHLVSARPMSVTMGNAIRELKLEISGSDIDLPEQDAKNSLCQKIDDYISERIIIADQIKDGDVILTYARSSVVEKVLIGAWDDGKQFSVVVVDSRPMLEGKKLLSVLSAMGIPCTYLLLPSIGSVITEVTTVLVGAHSLHSNGAVFSRAGTALVAMMAKQHSVPVVVCCETYKFSETIQLDSFTKNELAPSGDIFSSFPLTRSKDTLTLSKKLNLEILNPLYDLTPPSSITAVVTEVGVIPPSSISSIPLALGRTTL